jgi:CRP/FNR family transcriptional regulator, cyclic AMP receptor protein
MIKPLWSRLRAGTASPAPRPADGAAPDGAAPSRSGFADTAPTSSVPFADAIDAAEPAPSMARWSERRLAVGAATSDAAAGAALLSELWQADRHMAALSEGDRRRLAEGFQFVRVPAGQPVISQDEEGDYLLVVLDGQLAVERLQPEGGRVRLAEARAGEMLGEMSLLDAGARFSTCTTQTPCTLAVIEATRLTALLHDEPQLGVALLGSLSRRLSLRLRQLSARLSALLSRP